MEMEVALCVDQYLQSKGMINVDREHSLKPVIVNVQGATGTANGKDAGSGNAGTNGKSGGAHEVGGGGGTEKAESEWTDSRPETPHYGNHGADVVMEGTHNMVCGQSSSSCSSARSDADSRRKESSANDMDMQSASPGSSSSVGRIVGDSTDSVSYPGCAAAGEFRSNHGSIEEYSISESCRDYSVNLCSDTGQASIEEQTSEHQGRNNYDTCVAATNGNGTICVDSNTTTGSKNNPIKVPIAGGSINSKASGKTIRGGPSTTLIREYMQIDADEIADGDGELNGNSEPAEPDGGVEPSVADGAAPALAEENPTKGAEEDDHEFIPTVHLDDGVEHNSGGIVSVDAVRAMQLSDEDLLQIAVEDEEFKVEINASIEIINF